MLAGEPVLYRTAREEREGEAPAAPVVYLHGAPTSSEDWHPLLERTGGIAPDLFGFGGSAKGAHLENTPEALADGVEDLLSALGTGRYKLVTHGWGTAAGALLAARHPERVERLVLFNSVPLLEGQSWPWWVRLYRLRGMGELAMGSTTRTLLKRWLRRGAPGAEIWSPTRVRAIWEQFDQGTQRAVLRLVRSIDDERISAMQTALQSLRMPIMLVWGERDPWWDSAVLDAYAARLPGARIARIPGAGHWPWLEDPTVAPLTASFLENGQAD